MDISPDKQNIDKLFSNTSYYIDFYQRDYKWNDEPVRRLLDDIFYIFDVNYDAHPDLDPKPENVSAKYPWYYLNTYVTNTIDGRVFVVDGQQRLTTLTLILIKLKHLAEDFDSGLADWIKNKIAGYSGYQTTFWMNHERHIATMQALHDGEEDVPVDSGITAANMLSNYEVISKELEDRLTSPHKFETFVFFFLHRLVLINLSVEQTDVPMVFEVINDRGVKLRPHEILKGKLLGQIDKEEMAQGDFNALWEQCVSRVNAFKPEEFDEFFVYFLKAKFADTRGVGQKFDNDYHREIFKPGVKEKLKLERNPTEVKKFIKRDLEYYTKLYARLWRSTLTENSEFKHAFYNRLNEMDSHFHLILSACKADDPEEDEKLELITREVDRLFSLLRLQRAYDSNQFVIAVYEISSQIREKPVAEIAEIFDKKLLEILSERRGGEVESAFEYAQFKNTSINDVPTRFTRYFFARVDQFIAENTNMGSKAPFADLVQKTGFVNGFHIEHILSNNSANLELYDGDQESFDVDRNRLGAVLLLKGKDNQSSGNEPFALKLKSYANTLHWNETLREDSYKSKKDFSKFMSEANLSFSPYSVFSKAEVEDRHRLLFEIANKVWV